jgi:hypothetical protein
MPIKKIKRVFKKITKPIAKVLDKVIPNEIKPALPYLAAFAPILGPQMGLLSGLTKLQAAGVYGLGSLGAQLAQEGSEGDFDIAPIIAAAGTGYLAQPGQGIKSLQLNVPGKTTPYPELTFAEQAQNVGIKALQGAEKFFQQGQAASQAGEGILKTTAAIGKAAGPAITTQITQDAINTAQQALDDYNAELAEYERRTGEAQIASDDARRAAIRAAMIAGNHSEDVINETFALLGLKDGGVVKMKDGGIMDLGGKEMDLRGGGFVPIGKKERADDVPARLSKNEFVMTADAVRGAGGGNINEGARRMYETMNRLEARA